MKDIDVYTLDTQQTRRKKIMQSMVATLKAAPYDTLKEAIERHVESYIIATRALIQKQKFIPDIFCTHTASGLSRAVDLKQQIGLLANEDRLGLLNLVSTLNGGGYNPGSLKTFIAKAFHEVGTANSNTTRFSDKFDESVGLIIIGGEHSHHGAKADIGVVEFFKNIISDLKEYFTGLNNSSSLNP